MFALLASACAISAKPNVIVLFADDMGYSQPSAVSDRSGYAGINGTVATPNLDKMASESVVFTSWYSSFHCCTASRASMMTGRLSVRSGIGFVGGSSNGVFTAESVGFLPLNETTLAEAVKPAGYTTGMIGKWHLGQAPHHLPPSRGFDYYFGIPFSCDMGLSAWKFGNHSEQPYQARPLPLFNCTRGELCDDTKVVEQPTNLGTLSLRYAHAALEFIVQAHATSKPFLLYAPFNHVHAPNFAAVAFCNTSTHGPVGDATQELDHAIGVIANGVESIPRLDENTVWFFTSDNGAPIGNDNRGNGPLRDGKTTTWEGGIREPAFVRWKGTFAPRYTDALAATYDIYATVLGLAGVAAPTDRVLDGKDLQPILQSASGAAVHRCLIHYWSPQMANSKSSGTTSGVAAVRCGQYKAHFYVRNTGAGSNHKKTMLKAGVQSPPAVFDLDADISESNQLDVATNPAAAAALKEINAALDAHLAGVEMVPNQMVGPSGKQGCTISAATECVGGNDLNQAVCKDPDSRSKYPEYANCTSNPENWGTADCRAVNRTCIAKCLSTTF